MEQLLTFLVIYGSIILVCLVWGVVLYKKMDVIVGHEGLYSLVIAALISAGFPLFSVPLLIAATVWIRRV